MEHIVVATRLRPLLRAQWKAGLPEKSTECIVNISGSANGSDVGAGKQNKTKTVVTNPATGEAREFQFDHCFDSSGDPSSPGYADNSKVWHTLGVPMLKKVCVKK